MRCPETNLETLHAITQFTIIHLVLDFEHVAGKE